MDTTLAYQPISLVIFPDPEAWLRKNLPDMHSDSVACVYPMRRMKPGHEMLYQDIEENTVRVRSWRDHVTALRLLTEQVSRTLFVGGVKSPFDLLEPENWDAEVVDAYWQLVYYGEVIYG